MMFHNINGERRAVPDRYKIHNLLSWIVMATNKWEAEVSAEMIYVIALLIDCRGAVHSLELALSKRPGWLLTCCMLGCYYTGGTGTVYVCGRLFFSPRFTSQVMVCSRDFLKTSSIKKENVNQVYDFKRKSNLH